MREYCVPWRVFVLCVLLGGCVPILGLDSVLPPLLLSSKENSWVVLVLGLVSLTILCMRARWRASRRPRRTGPLPNYSAIAVCFFVSPTIPESLGYFLSGVTGHKHHRVVQCLVVCITLLAWWLAVAVVYIQIQEGKKGKDALRLHRWGLLCVSVLIGLMGVAIFFWPKQNPSAGWVVAQRVLAVSAGLGAAVSAASTWWTVVWQGVGSEAADWSDGV